MNYIILIFYSIVLPIISLRQKTPKTPKLCINCKYFIPDNDTGKFGKCSLFPKQGGKINYLVNGINDEYFYCSTSREHNNMCGEEGKYYKKKIVKNAHIK